MTQELTQELIFCGVKPVPAGTRSAQDFIKEIHSRKSKNNWNEERTMDYVEAALRGQAAEWYRKALKLQLGPEEWKRMKKNYPRWLTLAAQYPFGSYILQ